MNSRSVIWAVLSGAFLTGVAVGWQVRHVAPRQTSLTATPLATPPAVSTEAGRKPPTLSLDKLDGALTRALRELTAQRRNNALRRLSDAIAPADIPRAVTMACQRQEPEILDFLEYLLRRWSQLDAGAALGWAQSPAATSRRVQHLQSVLDEWATDAPDAACEWMAGLPTGAEKDQCWSTVLGAVAERDPPRALALLKTLGSLSSSNALLDLIVNCWARADPPGAATAAAKMTGLQAKSLASVAFRWAEKDTQAALVWAQGLTSSAARYLALEAVVQVWASTDPKAAAAFVEKQPSKATLACVVQQWSAVDPTAGIAWADGLAASPFRKQALQEVLEQCAQTAPELAVRYALPPDLDQSRIVSKIAEQWIKTDPEAALVWVKSLSESNLGIAARPVLLGLIGRDVTQAADFLLSLPSSHLRNKLHQELARAWASRDLQGAVAWAQRLPEGYARVYALEAVMPDWAQADSKAATAFALSLPKPDVRLWDVLAEEMTMAHPDEVMKWLASLPEGDSQVSARCWVVEHMAKRSPLEAATYISSLPPGKEQDDLARRVAFHWAEDDPRSAADWVDQFPAGPAHDASALMVVLRFACQDPVAAAAWYCSAVPNANSVEWAMTTLSAEWVRRDPTACAEWLDSIKAPPLSRFLAASGWLDLDREGARAWIERSAFSDEEKEELLNPKARH